MTCLICEKCEGQEFQQLQAYYDKNGVLTQVFKCKKCGVEKHVRAMASAIIIPPECLPKETIVVGKHNSPEKPCQFCGSTITCDCPLDVVDVINVVNAKDEESSKKLWSGIRVRYPPFSRCGKKYRTRFKSKKFGPQTRTMTVEMELIPEKEWRKQHARKSNDSSENVERSA